VKRILVLLAGIAIFGLATSNIASAKHAPNVKLAKTDKGKVLEASSGLVLFIFSRDSKNKDVCQKLKATMCPDIWPALTTKTKPTGGPGVKGSLLGTIKLSNGKKQITYKGHPLYTFGGDSPGDTSYVGQAAQGGRWFAINAKGNKVS
jgi:predicted lipoprotein with Yx(FWY)xxD motif